MIQIKNISLAFGEQIIFDNISAAFAQNQRVGLVGRNGAGKSTMLKIIAQQQKPDEGSISFSKDLRVAYMPQEIVLLSTKTVLDEAFSVFENFLAIEREMQILEADLKGEDVDRYAELQEALGQWDRSSAQARTVRILEGLGFNEQSMQSTVDTLSVGWRMRLVLTQLLLQDADFYLFDEPTNHLDIVTKEWFLNFLKNAKFGYLFISHDRYYLDRVCDYTFELERGIGTVFTGNFTKYLELKTAQRELVQSTYDRQSREVAQKMKTIERFRASASKAKMAQSMLKQVDKIELVKPESPLPSVTFSFPSAQRAGAIVLNCDKISHAFGERQIFTNACLEVQRGEKVALVAANGKGKTTLLNCIMGKLPLQKGSLTFGHNVQEAIFEQEQLHVLNPRATILEEVSNHCAETPESMIRGFLGSFLFSGDDVHKKISVLSGGERNRVAMVKVLLQKANFLILDEPTNHLDLYSKQVLLQALQQYQGTVLFVSHDHDFLNLLASRVVELTSEGLHSYSGNYESYIDQKEYYEQSKQVGEEKKNAPQIVVQKQAVSSKDMREIRKEIAALENKIEKCEVQREEINSQLLEAYGTSKYTELFNRLTKTQRMIDEHTERWEELQRQIDSPA